MVICTHRVLKRTSEDPNCGPAENVVSPVLLAGGNYLI